MDQNLKPGGGPGKWFAFLFIAAIALSIIRSVLC